MKNTTGLAITLSILAIVTMAAYFGTHKYTEYQQQKQTMAFLGADEDAK